MKQAARRALGCYLFHIQFLLGLFSTPQMEAICSSETSVYFKITLHKNPEDRAYKRRCENLKSYSSIDVSRLHKLSILQTLLFSGMCSSSRRHIPDDNAL
jgi:hypothetical protein